DTRIVGHRARRVRALVELVEPAVVLERIAGRDQPPDAVELQALDREQADGAVSEMRRVEGAAEQPDTHTVGVGRKNPGNRRRGNGRFAQRALRNRALLIDAFSSREPGLTPDRVRGRLSLENAMAFTAASVRCRGCGI